MSEIDALNDLKASLSYAFWDGAAYVTLFAVFIGVVGESILELTNLVTNPVRRAVLGKASALILIAGLGGEIVTHAKNNAISGIIIGFLHKEAGDAYEQAGKANLAAADANNAAAAANKLAQEAREHAATLEALAQLQSQEIVNLEGIRFPKVEQNLSSLQKQVANGMQPRDVDVDDLTHGMRHVKREAVTIVRLDDAEPRNFADKISAALRHLDFKVRTEDLKATSALTGVIVCQKGSNEIKLIKALNAARLGAKLMRQSAADRPDFCDVSADAGDTVSAVPILGAIARPVRGTVIFVGQRPLPKSP